MNYLICSTKPWNRNLAKDLNEYFRDKHKFHFVNHENILLFDLVHNKIAATAKIIFFVHWPWKIPKETYEKYTCIGFHTGHLPFERGGSPVVNLILQGRKSSFINAIEIVEELDAGGVYQRRPVFLHGSLEEIYIRMNRIIFDMIVDLIERKWKPKKQEGEVHYFKRRKPEENDIANVKTLEEVYDYIRMVDAETYEPAYAEVGRFKLEFSRAIMRTDGIYADVKISLKE